MTTISSPVRLAEVPIGEMVRQLADRQPDAPAVVDVGVERAERVWTWRDLDRQVDAAAMMLLEMGVAPGEAVALQLPNSAEFVLSALAVLRIGAVCCPLMPIFREREMASMLRRAGARVLVVAERFRGRDYPAEVAGLLAGVAGDPPSLEHVVVVGGDAPWPDESEPGRFGRPQVEPGRLGARPRWYRFADAVGARQPDVAALEARAPAPTALAQLLFTSGTSGEPKGVLQRMDALTRAAAMEVRHLGLDDTDRVFVPSPLAHQTGFLYGMWLAFVLGVPQILQPVWDGPTALAALRRWNGTFVQAATPFLADLVRAAEDSGQRPEALRIFVATGTTVPRALAERATEVLGAAVCGAWGSTETCLGSLSAPGDEPAKVWGTDGRALEGVHLRITDDDGNVLAAGEEGNFEVSSACLFEGYLDDPEQTAEALSPDGWYRSGDLAVIDEAGYVRISGRVKDVINRGGEKVPVAEVEQVLHTHPAVVEVAVVGMPDGRLGERACAFVVTGAGSQPVARFDLTEMQRFLDAQRMAKQYWPERVEIVAELPRNPAGKVQKFVLRDQARELLEEGEARMSVEEAELATLAKEVEDFVRGPGEEYAGEIERTHAVPSQLWDDLRRRGYLSLAAPELYGGRGIAFSRYLDLLELFAMSHASVRMIVHVCNGVWRAIDQFATEEQRKAFVLPQIAGDIRVAFTLTEPTAGTGADLRSSVTRQGDTYYLSGEKHLITFGVDCDYWLLFARLAGTVGKEGTVALMVDRHTEGVEVEAMPETMGVRGTDHARLRFEGAPVPVANRLGDEGRGLDVALGGFLTPSRISVAMSCVGLARRAQELAVEHARVRETFGKPLIARQAIAFALAENATDIEAARQLTLHAGRRWEDGDRSADTLSSMAKLNAVDMLTRVTDKALQVHGGIGYWEPNPIERIYRDARAQRFEEGTNEIQKTVIARQFLR